MIYTKKINGYYVSEFLPHYELIQKLGKIEEYERNCRLEILEIISANECNFWYIQSIRDGHKYIYKYNAGETLIDFYNECFVALIEDEEAPGWYRKEIFKFKDYKKEWAFRKEDLE